MASNGGADDVCSIISQELAALSPSPSECCIFKIHKHLRGINEKSYEPEVIAIGPYHRGKDNLKMMEVHKLRYLQSLLRRKNENSLEKYVNALESLEQKARKCYAETISLEPNEFIKMMLLDGCFIVEVMRKFKLAYLRDRDDFIFKMDWIVVSLQRDLMLFENQLPFFVLCELFDLIEVPNNRNRFIYLALQFFRDLFPGPGYRERGDGNSHDQIKHLLGLIHNNWLPSFAGKDFNKDYLEKTKNWRFIPSTTELQEAGIKLKKAKLKKAEGGSLFDIEFRRGVMQIPTLTIEDRSESFFRNLIAYEQYCSDNQFRYIADYMKFMDCLINSPKDVEILCRAGIVENWLGDDEVVSIMFNKITDSVTGPDIHFQYSLIFNEVNTHCSKKRNRWMAKLRRNHLNSPWAVISILAAFALLVLTLMQTLCNFVECKHKNVNG